MPIKTFNSFLLAVALMSSVFFLNSCDKDAENASLKFHWHNQLGDLPVAYNLAFETENGRQFSLSGCHYYVSNIVLIQEDGTELPIGDTVFLVSPAERDYELGMVPTGNYKGFKFMLGVDSLRNHADPTLQPVGSPLAVQTPSMHWSWNSGYLFFRLEGMVDSTATSDQAPNKEFSYHVGTDALSRQIDFSTSAFSVSGKEGDENEIGIIFDILKVLEDIDLTTEFSSHTFDNLPLATKIADSWQDAITVEEE